MPKTATKPKKTKLTPYEWYFTKLIKIIEETKVLPWKKTWKGSTTRKPTNVTTMREYSGVNRLVLLMVRYAYRFRTNYWGGHSQLRKAGMLVKKGQHGFPIIYPKIKKLEKDDPRYIEGKKTHVCIGFRASTIFNIDQCDNVPEELFGIVEDPDHEHQDLPQAEEINNNFPNPPKIVHEYPQADYDYIGDYVNVAPESSFNCSEEYYSTIFHELGHATGHKSRLDRNRDSIINRKPYSFEELIAEFTACYLCHEIDISTKTEKNSVAYLQGWLRFLNDKPKALLEASRLAEKAIKYIKGEYVPPPKISLVISS